MRRYLPFLKIKVGISYWVDQFDKRQSTQYLIVVWFFLTNTFVLKIINENDDKINIQALLWLSKLGVDTSIGLRWLLILGMDTSPCPQARLILLGLIFLKQATLNSLSA